MSGTSKTEIKVHLSAVDRVSASLKAVGEKLRNIVRHPVAATKALVASTAKLAAGFVAAGAALATAVGAAVVNSAKRLSALTDAAARAGTASSDLHKLSVVLSEVGVKASDIDSLAVAFQKMAANTGRVGMEGFKETLREISLLESEGERVEALQKAFGRTGVQLAHLVRQGPDALSRGLDGMLASVVAVNDQIADSADGVADGYARVIDGLKVGWDTFVVSVAQKATQTTGKTSAQLGALIAARFAYWGELAAAYFDQATKFFRNCVSSWRQDSEAFRVWLGTRLLQMMDGITGPVMHLFSRLWGYCKAIYGAIVAMFTDKDIGEEWRKAIDEQEEAWELFHAELMKPVEMPGEGLIRSTLADDLEAARKRYEEKKAQIEGLADATADLASGAPLAMTDAGKDIAKRITDAFRNSSLILGDSYQAFAMGFNRNRTGVHRVAPSPIPDAFASKSADRARTEQANAGTLAAIKEALTNLLKLQTAGWPNVAALADVGAV